VGTTGLGIAEFRAGALTPAAIPYCKRIANVAGTFAASCMTGATRR
jgi:hypothetical protein